MRFVCLFVLVAMGCDVVADQDSGDAPQASDHASSEPTDAIDDNEPIDAGVPPVAPPVCPETMPNTGSIAGADLTREGFGCYGGCGPSCKAACEATTLQTVIEAGDACVTCSYRALLCQSHSYCRYHDDCYRQCDLRWATTHGEAPATPPSNACYRNCDNVVVSESAVCGVDWAQQLTDTPDVTDACWDGSIVVLTALEATVDGCVATDTTTRPFLTASPSWEGDPPPAELPRGYSCSNDDDCPDRNDICDPDAGDYYGVNGWGRCIPGAGPLIDTRPLVPPGTWLTTEPVVEGACVYGAQCHSGRCNDAGCQL